MLTLQSDFTFKIPRDITDISGGTTARMKRISLDGAVPVILEASANIDKKIIGFDFDDYDRFIDSVAIVPKFSDRYIGNSNYYIAYKEGATLDTIVSRRIMYVEPYENDSTGTVSINSSDPTLVVGSGTLFSSELEVGYDILIDGERRVVREILSNTSLRVDTKFNTARPGSKLKYYTFLIELQNPRNEHWDDFPTVDTLVMWVEEDNVRYINDNCVECYYRVQSNNTQQLVYDIDFTPDAVDIDLQIERGSYRYDINKERVRIDDIFNPDSYIYEAKDTSGVISQNIYTWENIGEDVKVSLRHEFNITLADQLLKIRLYPSDIDEYGNTGLTDWSVKIDVIENTAGKRYNLNFKTV